MLRNQNKKGIILMEQNIKGDKNIGANIRKWRGARGMTQEELSANCRYRAVIFHGEHWQKSKLVLGIFLLMSYMP